MGFKRKLGLFVLHKDFLVPKSNRNNAHNCTLTLYPRQSTIQPVSSIRSSGPATMLVMTQALTSTLTIALALILTQTSAPPTFHDEPTPERQPQVLRESILLLAFECITLRLILG